MNQPAERSVMKKKPRRATWYEFYYDVVSYRSGDSDNIHYIFEAAMGAVYGHDVWGWINERL